MRTQGYLAFAAGICLTVWSCMQVRDAQQASIRATFARDTEKIASDANVRLQIYFDMLLSLYINEDHQEDCITTLTAEVGAPMTTMLRWLAHLEREGRVIGKQDVTDARTRFIYLTDKGRTEMDGYFRESMGEVGPEY